MAKKSKSILSRIPFKQIDFWLACAVLLLGGAFILAGCAFTDAITGVGSADDNSGGFLGGLGKAIAGLPGWLGLLGTAIGGSAAGYQAYRKKQLGVENASYDEMVNALVAGIEDAVGGGLKETVSKEDLYKALELAKTKFMSDPALLAAAVAEIKSRLRSA